MILKYSFISFFSAILLVFGSLNMPSVLRSYYIIFCLVIGIASTLMSMKNQVTMKNKWMSIFLSLFFVVAGFLIYTALIQ